MPNIQTTMKNHALAWQFNLIVWMCSFKCWQYPMFHGCWAHVGAWTDQRNGVWARRTPGSEMQMIWVTCLISPCWSRNQSDVKQRKICHYLVMSRKGAPLNLVKLAGFAVEGDHFWGAWGYHPLHFISCIAMLTIINYQLISNQRSIYVWSFTQIKYLLIHHVWMIIHRYFVN